MAFDPNWPRWIWASTSKHFADVFSAEGVPLFVEGDDRDTESFKDFAEFRLDGPRWVEVSRNYFRLDVPINVLLQSKMDDSNTHRIYRTIGTTLSAFIKINVFRFGDDDTFVGCLKLREGDPVRVNHFGQIDETVRILQATVEGHYRIHLHGSN